ncbi:hypothetical protein BGZ54_005587 [Gamsiella multidivaricata]|nr:hypothetical protein BGZ54_005587 [Gamsiella multidivaricata]
MDLDALPLAWRPFTEDLVTGVKVPRPYAIFSPWLYIYAAHSILSNYGNRSLMIYLRTFRTLLEIARMLEIARLLEDAKSTALSHVSEILKGAGTSLAVYEEMPRDFRSLTDRQPNSDKLGQHAELDTEALAAKAAHDLDLCKDDQKAL